MRVIEGSLLILSGSTLSLSARMITVREKIGTSQADGDDTDGASVTLIASEDVVVNGLIRTTGYYSSVTAGQTYTIVVDGYGGAAGSCVLTVTPPRAAPHDAHVRLDGTSRCPSERWADGGR